MMMTINETIEKIETAFQLYKGKIYCRVKSREARKKLIQNVFLKIKNKRPNKQIWFIVPDFSTKKEIENIINEVYFQKYNEESAYRIISEKPDRIREYIKYNIFDKVSTIIGIDIANPYDIRYFSEQVKFMLYLSTGKLPEFNKDSKSELNNYLTEVVIDDSVDSDELPVYVYSHPISLSDELRVEYDKINGEIEKTIKVIGSFDNLDLLRKGCRYKSRVAIAKEIAEYNGWNQHLDTSSEINRQIDELYNPAEILKRAENAYQNMLVRRLLVSDYEGKIEKIKHIILENPGKKIIIISKRGEFANKIMERLNEDFGKEVCGAYHNEVKSGTLTDENGNVITYSTGINAGKPKQFGALAKSKKYLEQYQNGELQYLSAKNCTNDLVAQADMMIITTPIYETLSEILKKFGKLQYNDNKREVHIIYCENTIEANSYSGTIKTIKCKVMDNNRFFTDDNTLF